MSGADPCRYSSSAILLQLDASGKSYLVCCFPWWWWRLAPCMVGSLLLGISSDDPNCERAPFLNFLLVCLMEASNWTHLCLSIAGASDATLAVRTKLWLLRCDLFNILILNLLFPSGAVWPVLWVKGVLLLPAFFQNTWLRRPPWHGDFCHLHFCVPFPAWLLPSSLLQLLAPPVAMLPMTSCLSGLWDYGSLTLGNSYLTCHLWNFKSCLIDFRI